MKTENYLKIFFTMAKKEKKLNAKQKAFAKKQEQEGHKVINWIFGVLILLAIVLCAYFI